MLNEQIRELRKCFDKIIDPSTFNSSYIEINVENEVVLSANQEGMMYLINILINLCETEVEGNHFHLDEYNMLDKSEKQLIIQIKNANW